MSELQAVHHHGASEVRDALRGPRDDFAALMTEMTTTEPDTVTTDTPVPTKPAAYVAREGNSPARVAGHGSARDLFAAAMQPRGDYPAGGWFALGGNTTEY